MDKYSLARHLKELIEVLSHHFASHRQACQAPLQEQQLATGAGLAQYEERREIAGHANYTNELGCNVKALCTADLQ